MTHERAGNTNRSWWKKMYFETNNAYWDNLHKDAPMDEEYDTFDAVASDDECIDAPSDGPVFSNKPRVLPPLQPESAVQFDDNGYEIIENDTSVVKYAGMNVVRRCYRSEPEPSEEDFQRIRRLHDQAATHKK